MLHDTGVRKAMRRRKFLISVGGVLLLPLVPITLPSILKPEDVKLIPWDEQYADEELVEYELHTYIAGLTVQRTLPTAVAMLPESMSNEDKFRILETIAYGAPL